MERDTPLPFKTIQLSDTGNKVYTVRVPSTVLIWILVEKDVKYVKELYRQEKNEFWSKSIHWNNWFTEYFLVFMVVFPIAQFIICYIGAYFNYYNWFYDLINK